MSGNKALSQIPIVVVAKAAQPNQRLHWARRAFQFGVVTLALAIPISGLFRIDPAAGAFVVLDRQIGFSDFYIVVGFWLAVSSLLVMLYSVAGTVFCGWACPQNMFSEFANLLTHKLLGKRADVMLNGGKMAVAASKNRWYNWLALGAIFLAVAMAAALIPMFYFYTPRQVWSFVTFQQDATLAGSLHWIYTVFVLILFVDIAFIRHFMCRFMCVYKVWQHTFKTKETLHVAYDQSRADQCAKCNYCVTACFVGIDPRKTDTYDTCINCGECITACNSLQAKKNGAPGLLRFAMGARDRTGVANSRTGLAGLGGRLGWAAPFLFLGIGLFIWGLVSYEPLRFTVYRSESAQGNQIDNYRVGIVNKIYHPSQVTVEVIGLQPQQYQLGQETVQFTSAQRQDVSLHINSDTFKPGVYSFVVRVASADGWEEKFPVQHFVASNRL